MEQQLRHLEERLQRRDRELATAIEDGKAAAKLEAARLKDIHLQALSTAILFVDLGFNFFL